jgi:hypothetical protein
MITRMPTRPRLPRVLYTCGDSILGGGVGNLPILSQPGRLPMTGG